MIDINISRMEMKGIISFQLLSGGSTTGFLVSNLGKKRSMRADR